MEDFGNWPNAATVGWTVAAAKVANSDEGKLKIATSTTHGIAMKTLVQHNNNIEEQWIMCAELGIALAHALPVAKTPIEEAVVTAFYTAVAALHNAVIIINNPG